MDYHVNFSNRLAIDPIEIECGLYLKMESIQ